MNENCLSGMQCPNCGSCGPFIVEVTSLVKLYNDGSNEDYGMNFDWDDSSYCECAECHHAETVRKFRNET